jgi:hypothetical protein
VNKEQMLKKSQTPLQLMEAVLAQMQGSGNPEKPVIPHGVKLQSCVFVSATSLVPKQWESWFWALISEDAPFSWGDNNRTMVSADAFADHCEARLENLNCDEHGRFPRYKPFLARVRALGNIYIDLES